LIGGGVSMTIPRFLSRWWRPLLVVALVLAAVATYALARGDGAPGGEFSASPTTSSAPEAAEPTTDPITDPGQDDGQGGVTPPTGNAPNGPTSSTDPSPGTRTTTGPTGTSRETTTRSSKPEHWAIRWILSLAPEGPTSPTSNVKPYMLLRDQKCSEALTWIDSPANKDQVSDRERAIYRGTATACLAAFHQQPRRWAEARRHLADAQSSSAQLNCPARLTLAWLQRVVGLHEQDPDRAFVAQQPQGIYATIQGLDPERGPEGTQVQAKGSNLDCVSSVSVDRKNDSKDAAYPPYTVDPSGRRLTFTAPDGFGPGSVDVTFDGNEDYVVGRATFTYQDSSGGG
jgi:hypothetical protein